MILVSGATGKTGRALVMELATMGVPVRALVRDRARAAQLATTKVELAVADLGQPATLAAALAGIRTAYLLTAADPQQVVLHSNFIRAAKRAGVRHIVRQSVRGADSRSSIKLAQWHAASQQELEDSGMEWTHLQPIYNMQNFFRFGPAIQSKGVLFAPMKDGALSMVDARDVAAVAAKVLTGHGHQGKAYVITGPEPLTFAEAAERLSQVLGTPVRYVDLPPEEARTGLLGLGMPEWYVDDLLGFYGFCSTGAAAVVSNTVARLTGHSARTFRRFVSDYRTIFAAPR